MRRYYVNTDIRDSVSDRNARNRMEQARGDQWHRDYIEHVYGGGLHPVERVLVERREPEETVQQALLGLPDHCETCWEPIGGAAYHNLGSTWDEDRREWIQHFEHAACQLSRLEAKKAAHPAGSVMQEEGLAQGRAAAG